MAGNNLRWEGRSVCTTASPDGLVRGAIPADAGAIAAVQIATWQHAARLTSPVS